MILETLLDLAKDPAEKRRVFDDFAYIFMLKLKIFHI